MLEIGKYNKLRILKEVDFGLYLDGFEQGEILLPKRYVPSSYELDDEIEVFIYNDSEDRIIATTLKPKASVGKLANLKLISINKFGSFFEWGLPKDLFVPVSEQFNNMTIGNSYMLFVYLDERSDRIAGSCKIERFLKKDISLLNPADAVDLIIYRKTEIGFKAIINETNFGLLYDNEIFQKLKIGQKIKGFIKTIRDDGKIDLSLQKTGVSPIEENGKKILTILEENGGFININDKSSPDKISQTFLISKKLFKKAIGHLYKNREIMITPDGIKLNDNSEGNKI